MAVDKKSDHYTSAQHYTDIDGQSKSFTFIDHDLKRSSTPLSLIRRWKDNKEVKSETQLLVEAIIRDKVNLKESFIQEYDKKLGKKYNFERYDAKHRRYISYEQMHPTWPREGWWNDLKALYERHK